jgi:hypothetical protein
MLDQGPLGSPGRADYLHVVVVIVVVMWLLQAFGLLGSLQSVRIR